MHLNHSNLYSLERCQHTIANFIQNKFREAAESMIDKKKLSIEG